MAKDVGNDFCTKEECEIEYDIMWGGYECYKCRAIGYLGLIEGGKSALYNNPSAAKASIEKYEGYLND